MDTAFPLATALLARDDVSGVMRSAFRYRAGAWVREDCIAVGVRQKRPLAELDESEVIPAQIRGVATDIIELNPKLATSLYSEKYSVVCGGISIGNVTSESSGTLGGIFNDTVNSVDCGLTNFHVMAGPDLSVPDSYAIHPSEEDGGTMSALSRIGISTRWMLDEWGDAAIFTLTKPSALSMLTSQTVLTDVVMPQVLDEVEKSGRTTGVTQGVVSGFGYVGIDYSTYGHGIIYMYCCSIIPLVDPDEMIVDGGDSGAIWYDTTTGAGLAIHVARTTDPVVAYNCILGYVLTDLDCALIPTDKRHASVVGSANLAVPASYAATGSLSCVESNDILTAKLFAVNDWEKTYGPDDWLVWVVDNGYADSATFLTDAGYDTVEEFVASFTIPVGKFFVATSTHTSAAATHPASGASWDTVWDVLSASVFWEEDTDFALEDIVDHEGAYYACVFAHTSDDDTEPGVGEYWNTVWQLIELWATGESYTVGDVVSSTDTDATQYATVAEFLADQTIPTLRDVLSSNGVVM